MAKLGITPGILWQRQAYDLFARAALAGLAGAALLLTTGCQQRIALPGLAPVTDEIATARRVVMANEKVAPTFPVEPQDILVFGSADGPLSLGTVEPKDLPRGWRGATLALKEGRERVSIPIWAAQSYGGLRVSGSGGDTHRICFEGGGGLPDLECNVTVGPNDNAAAMAEKIAAATDLDVEIRPRPSPHLMPGDEVNVTLDWHLSFVETPLRLSGLYQFSENLQATVGPDGRIALPRLRLGSPLFQLRECDRFPGSATDPMCSGGRPTPLPRDNRAFSRERAVVAALESHDDMVMVWRADGERIHLWRVEWCLNAVGWQKRGFVDEKAEAECRALGVDEAFLPGPGEPEYLWPRYTLGAGRQEWTLVDDNGVAHRLPLVAGSPIEEQVRATYPRLTGQTIDTIRGINGTPAFLVVVPADGSPAFLGQTAPGGSVGLLDNVALVNGDRVFVTRLHPKASDE